MKKIDIEILAQFLYQQIQKRCLLEGCRYGIEHVDKKPKDYCIYCNEPRVPINDFYFASLDVGITKTKEIDWKESIIRRKKK